MTEKTANGLALYEMAPLEKQAASKLRDKDRQEKVMFIYDLSTQLRFERGRTTRDLALIWGCSPHEVAAMARDAKTILTQVMKGSVLSPEELRYELFQKLEFILADSMSAKKQVLTKDGEIVTLDAPDRRSAIHAIDKVASLFGLHQKPVENPAADYAQLTRDQLDQEVERALGQIRAAKDEVAAEGTGTDDDDETERLHEQSHSPNIGHEPLASGGGPVRKDRTRRTRSTDFVHGGPGVPDSAPKRLRKSPKGFRGQPGRTGAEVGGPEEGTEEG